MAKIPMHDKFKWALEQRGWRVDPNTRVTKCTVMRHPSIDMILYLGTSGALRATVGSKGGVDDSIPHRPGFRDALLSEWANAQDLRGAS